MVVFYFRILDNILETSLSFPTMIFLDRQFLLKAENGV